MKKQKPPLPDIGDGGESRARADAAHYAPIGGMPVHVCTLLAGDGRRRWFWTGQPPEECRRHGWRIELTIHRSAVTAAELQAPPAEG